MPATYERLPLDESEEEEEDAAEPRSCLDTLRKALPGRVSGTDYLPLSTAPDTAHTTSVPSPSCLEYMLRSVPSFRSHSRYSSVPYDDTGSDEDVAYEVDAATPLGEGDAVHQNGGLELQYHDHLHLLSTAHGVHGVHVPYQTRGSLKRIPAAATRLVRKTKANTTISKGVKVLRKKVRSVRWSETSRLFCRWLLNYKRLLPIVSVVTVVAVASSTLTRTRQLSEDLHTEHTLLMEIKNSLESFRLNHSSTPASDEGGLQKQTGGPYSNSTNSANDDHMLNVLGLEKVIQIMDLLTKVSSDVKQLSEIGNILSKMDKNLDRVMARTLLADRRRVPEHGIGFRGLSSTARSRGIVSLPHSALTCCVCVALVSLVLRVLLREL